MPGNNRDIDDTQKVLDAIRRVCRSDAIKPKTAEARCVASARKVSLTRITLENNGKS